MGIQRVKMPAIYLALAWCSLLTGAHHATAGMLGIADAAAMARIGKTPEESSESLAQQIAGSHPAATAAIEKNDVRGLTDLHLKVQQSIALLREHVDESILRGSWREQSVRTSALDVLSRLEGMRILSRINVAFLTDYPTSTGKVSASVSDATERLFRQAEILSEQISTVNDQVLASAPAKK